MAATAEWLLCGQEVKLSVRIVAGALAGNGTANFTWGVQHSNGTVVTEITRESPTLVLNLAEGDYKAQIIGNS
jgi:hypothetical protein